MSRFLRALSALALVTSAGVAHAFVRSTTVPFHPDQGLWLFWKPRQISYLVNASAFAGPGCSTNAAAAALARASFSAWMNATLPGQTQACTDFKFIDGGDTTRTELGYDKANPSHNINLVAFRKGPCSAVNDPLCTNPANGDLGPCVEAHNCWSHDVSQTAGDIIALTTVTFLTNTGEIVDADMELNAGDMSDTSGFYFTCAPPSSPTCQQGTFTEASCVAFDIGNAVTHEAGHMLGLDHVCVPSYPAPYNACGSLSADTMYPSATEGDTNKRTLKTDDIQAVCTIYPTGQSTAASPTPSNSGGCSSTGISTLPVLLAVALAFWRRSRPPTCS